NKKGGPPCDSPWNLFRCGEATSNFLSTSTGLVFGSHRVQPRLWRGARPAGAKRDQFAIDQPHQLAQRSVPEPIRRAAFLDDGWIDANQFGRGLAYRITLPHRIAVEHLRATGLVARHFPAASPFRMPERAQVRAGAFDYLDPRFGW